jgi:hypothetical protein
MNGVKRAIDVHVSNSLPLTRRGQNTCGSSKRKRRLSGYVDCRPSMQIYTYGTHGITIGRGERPPRGDKQWGILELLGSNSR